MELSDAVAVVAIEPTPQNMYFVFTCDGKKALANNEVHRSRRWLAYSVLYPHIYLSETLDSVVRLGIRNFCGEHLR